MPGASAGPLQVGLITASQRPVRAGPQISAFVREIITSHLASHRQGTPREIEIEDIYVAFLGLPLLDEPDMPSRVEPPDGYTQEHTRRWSRRVLALDGFVFVTPQYNWGVPAGLKNAIDYLYHEWVGKPAMIVSYGGHGGDKAARHLREVLGGGLRMRFAEEEEEEGEGGKKGGVVCLAFPGREVVARAARGEDLGLSGKGESAFWGEKKGEIVEAWEAFVGLLLTSEEEAGKVK